MQRMFRSFEKNAKERENVAFFWKERMPNPGNSIIGFLMESIVFLWSKDQKIESLLSIFFKDRRDRLGHGRSF